jgi:hypothetical protein
MDSVQVVLHAMTKRLAYYPLLMRDSVILPDIVRQMRRPGRDHERLVASVRAVPADTTYHPSMKDRILASSPWRRDEEVFAKAAEAYAIVDALKA